MVSWVLTELLRTGLITSAAHVGAAACPQIAGRFFRYRLSHSEDEVRAGSRSQYYPVELSDVLRTIRLAPGRYAVVGVPCFIEAVQLLRREDSLTLERIVFTLGLFCGHIKSARLMECFAWQMGLSVAEVQHVEFRLKDFSRPASTYTARFILGDGRVMQKDWWNMADGNWGAGSFQNPARASGNAGKAWPTG